MSKIVKNLDKSLVLRLKVYLILGACLFFRLCRFRHVFDT